MDLLDFQSSSNGERLTHITACRCQVGGDSRGAIRAHIGFLILPSRIGICSVFGSLDPGPLGKIPVFEGRHHAVFLISIANDLIPIRARLAAHVVCNVCVVAIIALPEACTGSWAQPRRVSGARLDADLDRYDKS